VIECIKKSFGSDKKEMLKVKEERKQKRGGFDKKIFLEKNGINNKSSLKFKVS